MELAGMLAACRDYIAVRVFPIVYMIDKETAYVLGTGFLVQDEDIIHLITARHVLEEKAQTEYASIAFPIFGPKRGMYGLPRRPYLSSKESNADLAVVPLLYPKADLDQLYWKTFALDSFCSQNEIDNARSVIVHGYPTTMQESQKATPFLNIGMIDFTTEKYNSDLSTVPNYRPDIDVLFEYKNEITINGESTRVPDLPGISGSPVFCINHTSPGIWSPDRHLRIVGVEKAVTRNLYIRATKATCLASSLRLLFDRVRADEK